MREKGIDKSQAMDSVRVQRLIKVCDTKENTVLYLLEEWNYEPQVIKFVFRCRSIFVPCPRKLLHYLYLILFFFNYLTQVYRFIKLLRDSGVDLAALRDFDHNTALHLAARKNYVTLAEFLVTSYPGMLLATNCQGELPLETAIAHGQDDVGAFLIRQMDHRRLVKPCR